MAGTTGTDAQTKPKDKTEPPKDTNTHGGDAATATSQHATTPGDQQALAAVRGQRTTGGDGNLPTVTLSTPAATEKPAITPDAATAAAKALHDAKDHKEWGISIFGAGIADPEFDKMRNLLEPQSAANRKAIEDAYAKQYPGHKLMDDLRDALGAKSENFARLQGIMARKDGGTDDAGQVASALATADNAAGRQGDRRGIVNTALDFLSPAKGLYDAVKDSEDGQKRQLAEADVRKTIGNMTEAQLNEARQAYKATYGKDMDQELLNDKNLSEGTREALKVLLKGNDHILGNSPEAMQNTLALADIGLKYKNSDIFNNAFQNASPEARKQFLDNGGSKKIDDAFSGDDRDKAHSYVERGAANLAMFVEGDHHWYHTNKDEITRLMTGASDQDRQSYSRGKDLVDGKQTPSTDADKQAVDFYNRLHNALKDAAGTDREVADWESKLMKQEKVITDALESHNDGTNLLVGRLGAGTDKNKLFGAVENLTPEDWARFRAHPEDLNKLDTALKTFASDEERTRVMDMMRAKLAPDVKDFDASKNVGRRSVDEQFADNKDNPGGRLDALAHMSDKERAEYKANPKHFDDLANQLPEGVARFAAQRVLQEIKDGKPTDKVDAVLADAVKNADPAQTLRDIQNAFKADPTLRDRLNNPTTDADKQVSQFFHNAADDAMYRGFYSGISMGDETGQATVQALKQAHEDTKELFDKGTVSLDKMVSLDGDNKDAKLQDILNASDADKKLLLENPPHDDATKKMQERILGTGDEKEMMQYAVKQGKFDDADTFRAYVLGNSNVTPEALRAKLDAMTPDQRQDLANEYYTKYHKLITADVIDKVPNEEKFRFREALSPTDVSVRQINLDARADLYNHTSAFDQFMNDHWDKSKQAALESNDNLNKFIKDHADELDKLTPEQRKQFMDAVDNYQTAIKNYVNSKGEFAEMVVDAAITVAAIGGAAFTGGGSLALLTAIGAGTAGALFRVSAMRAIQGGDFDSSGKNVGEQLFKGFGAAALGFLGPEALGLDGLVPVGEGVAARTAESVLAKVGQAGVDRTAFRVSEDVAEQTLKDGLSSISRQGALIGKEQTEKQIAELATKVLGDGATAEQREALQATIRQELAQQLKADLRQQVINQSEALFSNMATGAAANSATELAATGLGFESPDTLLQRIGSSALSGAIGAGIFHIGFQSLGAGWRGLKAVIGRDESGLFVGKGTWMERTGPDGKPELNEHGEPVRFQVTDERYRPAANERIVENVKQGDPLYDRAGTQDVTRAGDNGPPKRGADTDIDGRPLSDGNRARIREEFKPMTEAEFNASREKVVEDLKNQKVANGESVYDRLQKSPLSDEQKQQVLSMLAEVREHYMSLNVDGKVLSDQEVNWIHTQGELSRVLESSAANKLTPQETTDAMIASMFSDSAKYGQTQITQNNFWSHHLDGALAASEVLGRHGFPPERIDSIVQAIREHQIAPPEFMGSLYRMKIEGTLNAQIKAATEAGDAARLEHLNHLKEVLNSEGPEGMMGKNAEGKPVIRQIADINNQELVKNGNGEWEVKLTDDQRELLKLSGNDGHWYVPKDPTGDPEFAKLPKEQQDRLLSEYKISRALIDGDGIDNYATINGVSKIVKIRGPQTFFKDGTVWDSVRSVDTSYNDAYKVLTPEGQKIAASRLAEKNQELFGADGKFHDYRETPPKADDKSAEAEMYRWLVAQGRNPSEGIPFYNEPLKYPKDGLTIKENSDIAQMRKEIADPNTSEVRRDQLEHNLTNLSGLNAKEWNDYDFAKQIRDQMTDILRGHARMDGIPPGDFAPVRGRTDEPVHPGGYSPGDGMPQGLPGPEGKLNGADVQFYDNQLKLGGDYNPSLKNVAGVSRHHAVVNFDPVTGEMRLTDTSSHGTWIKRAEGGNWERIQNGETTLKPGDEVHLGSQRGPSVEVRPPLQNEHGINNEDTRLFLNGRPVDIGADGTLPVGRSVKGADGQPYVTDDRVSRNHGTLRYDEINNRYIYRDNNSRNGTYINGVKIEPGKEYYVSAKDDIRLGAKDGQQLSLLSLKPEETFKSPKEAGVFVGGKELPLAEDGTMKIGRYYKDQGITDTRVSREQGQLRFNQADNSFYFRDDSSGGTYIKRGDHYERLPKGQEVKIKPDDDIRLGSTDGPKLELFKKTDAGAMRADTQFYVNGQPQFFGNDGAIHVGRSYQRYGRDNINMQVSRDHGLITRDAATGEYTYKDTSSLGSFVKRLDWSVEHVKPGGSTAIRAGEEIHLGTEDGPVVKFQQTPGRELRDGSILYKRPDGDLIRRPDGSSVFDDRAGFRRVTDSQNRVVEASAWNNGRMYEYGADNKLNKVTFSDGTTWTTKDGDNWISKTPDGKEHPWKGKISVESDGALRYESPGQQPFVQRLDGSRETFWPGGRVEYSNENYQIEAARLEASIKQNYPDANQGQRFRYMLHEISMRQDISTEQKAAVLHQINRLLQTGGEASLPLAARTRLAEQLAFNTAHPELIDQGANKTCNVTTLEVRAFMKNPADAVHMVTDVALTGKYVTPSGVEVNIERVGGLKPDNEAVQALQNPYKPGGLDDVKSDGKRSYASQLFEETAVNVNYALHPERAGAGVQPGDVVAYKKLDVPGGTDTGERLVVYRQQPDGSVKEVPLKDAPSLSLSDMQEVYQNTVPIRDASGKPIPNPERNFIWNAPGNGNGYQIRDAQAFQSELWLAQQQGRMPIVLMVRGDNPLINNNGPKANGHAWHVVTVRSITMVNGQPRVEYTNQWGTRFDHLGANAVNPNDLFNAMK